MPLNIVHRESRPAHITTDRTITRDLRAVLLARSKDAGTTVGDFIAALRESGLRDSDPLGLIEFGLGQTSTRRIFVETGEDGWEVREVR